MKTRFFSLFLLSLVFFSAVAVAQTFRGGIQGTVTDSSGAAIAGAEVTVKSAETGLVRTVTTNDQGDYLVTELPLGTYSVSATKQGFRAKLVNGVTVAVAANTRADVQLAPGEVKEEVVVIAEPAPFIDTTGNTLGGTLQKEQLANLPVNGGDFAKLLTLVPGAGSDPNGDSDSPGSFGTFSINGNRGRANNYLLDGTDMNDGYRNDPAINEAGVFGTPATLLPIDALEEVAVLSNMEPEYGRNSGAVVNIVTKSGTNTIHGSGFEYFRNNGLDARNAFNSRLDSSGNPIPQDVFHNNQYGGSLGGPIIKDKTFWFVAYEGWHENGGLPGVASVPSQARVNAFTGGGGVINPVIANLLQRNPWSIPLPAVGDTGADNATVQVTDHFNNRVDSLILKIDQHLGQGDSSDLLTARYFFGDSDQSFPLALGGGTTVPGFNTVTPTRVQVLSLSYTHLLSPKLLLEIRGGWNRFAEGFFPEDQNFDPSTIGLNTGVTNPQDFGLPQISFSDGTSGLGGNNSIPRHRFDTNWQYFTNLAYQTGRHNLKFGYEYRRTTVNQFYDLGYRGRLKFLSFEDFLAGNITNGGSQFAGDSQRTTHQNNSGFYVQDNFRFSRKLTVNAGLRWDYFGVIYEDGNRFSLFDPATDSLQLVGQGGGPSSLYPKDLNNFAPRLSAAYDIFGSGNTILRAGWGLYYDAFSQDFFIGHFPFNTFNPGPAYNGVGASAINAAGNVAGTIVNGAPIFTSFSPTADAWTVDPNIRTPYIQNYNVNVEQALGKQMALTVGYVGSAGTKLFRFRDINQEDPATSTFPFAGFNIINQFESTASSRYNSLQVTWKLRNWRRVNSQLSWTWSHSIDNASDGEDFVPNAAQPDNSLNPGAEKGNSNFDARHRLTWMFGYTLPNPSVAKALTHGWSVNGLLRLSSGQPYNLNSFEDFNNSNEFFERPDIVGNPFAGTGGHNKLLNLGAFAAPCDWDPVNGVCFGGFHFGNLGRNAFIGPDFRNFDFSLAKDTKLNERLNMQFRADIFNLFNHPNFSNPTLPNFLVDLETNGGVASVPGDPKCAAAPFIGCRAFGQGFLPTNATPDVAIGYPFLGGGGSRDIQLALKFTF
ncbi:MAG TPA: carboxypeptidase regulatory-like domain-containing protein [Candidatus Angelobacter sp.]|nr:carboxypeptidase regulatory-like domain-containing protein [Candidatus Angelobacter sp.]